MASLNKTQLIGNLGADPVVRYTPAGAAIASVSIATTDKWKDKQTGEAKERTEWHRVVFFKGLAEVVAEHLKKGAQVYVEGRLRTRSWTDKDGVVRYTTEVIADQMQMLGKKPAGEVLAVPKADDVPAPVADDMDDDIPY